MKIKGIWGWWGKEFMGEKRRRGCCWKEWGKGVYKKKKGEEGMKGKNELVEKKIDEKGIERMKEKGFVRIRESGMYVGVRGGRV